MTLELGIIFAFAAMLCWGFGDFLEQKSTRKFGNWETIFFITFIGAIILTPFVYKDLPLLFSFQDNSFYFLLITATIYLIAALFDLESLKEGKLAVVEPIWSLEIPVAALAAFFIINEVIAGYQIVLIAALIVGLVLVSLKSSHFNKKAWLEKGVFIAILAAFFMGMTNFLIGMSSRLTNPLVAKWFFDIFLMLASLIAILFKHKFNSLIKAGVKNWRFILSMSLLDNAAWLAFGFAMVLAPIAIAVALSESYIILAVLLGMYVNKEKLRIHQKIGLVIAIISAITLAVSVG